MVHDTTLWTIAKVLDSDDPEIVHRISQLYSCINRTGFTNLFRHMSDTLRTINHTASAVCEEELYA